MNVERQFDFDGRHRRNPEAREVSIHRLLLSDLHACSFRLSHALEGRIMARPMQLSESEEMFTRIHATKARLATYLRVFCRDSSLQDAQCFENRITQPSEGVFGFPYLYIASRFRIRCYRYRRPRRNSHELVQTCLALRPTSEFLT